MPQRNAVRGYTASLGVGLDVYLIDGTYELSRHYCALPSLRDREGRDVGAVRGVLVSLLEIHGERAAELRSSDGRRLISR